MTATWEDMVSLNSGKEPAFELLSPAKDHLEGDLQKGQFTKLDYAEALARDTWPLPVTKDREGYYGPNHFSYWASGLSDARNLLQTATQHGVKVRDFLDIGCASGRVLRHMALEDPGINPMGCDINRLHAEWCNLHLPPQVKVFHSSSVPSLPLADNSVDMVSAFSVFTHIESFETAWLMEINRILRPGGIAWLTVHSEHTLTEMNENWPLWKAVMGHPNIGTLLDAERRFKGDRLVVRWRSENSYSSNVFYRTDYLRKVWGRFMEIVELRRRFPNFQDVLIMRKRG